MFSSGFLKHAFTRFPGIIVLLSIVLSTGCAAVMPPHLTRAHLHQMEGSWRSDGYGYLLKIKRGHVWVYDITRQACVEDKISTHEFAYGYSSIKWRDSDAFRLGQERNGKHIEFQRIPALPAACAEKPQNNPIAVLDAFANTMSEHYAFFKLHNIDWSQRVELAKRKINKNSSDQQLFDTLKELLHGFSDSHLGFRARVGNKTRTYTRRTLRHLEPALQPHYQRLTDQEKKQQTFSKFRQSWVKQQRKRVASQLLGKQLKSAADGKLHWGRVADRGYLAINQFVGFSPTDSISAEIAAVDQHLVKILDDLSGVRSIVVDVSLARGGYSSVATTIASHLAGLQNDGVVYHYLTRYAADAESQRQHKVVMRSKQLRKTALRNSQGLKPPAIILVTSDVTTSAAEEFVLAMRALPNVTHTGTATNGSLSDILGKPLPNGWLMILSNEVLLDPAGISFEGIGIAPDLKINLFDSDQPSVTHSSAIEELFRR